jgi:hypothetical protein
MGYEISISHTKNNKMKNNNLNALLYKNRFSIRNLNSNKNN